MVSDNVTSHEILIVGTWQLSLKRNYFLEFDFEMFPLQVYEFKRFNSR